jgi:hypothetical protein
MITEVQLNKMSQLKRLTWRFDVPNTSLSDNLPPGRFPASYNKYRRPRTDLGTLGLLPLELLHMSISQLDIQTLADFRRVSQRAMQVVDSIPLFKKIVTRAPLVLRAILNIGVGQWITCEELYDELCTAECRSCGEFGECLYILGTCERVCFICFSEKKRFLPLSRREAIRKFGLTQRIVDALPRMKSIPGIYSERERNFCVRRNLVDSKSARRAGIALHGSSIAMKRLRSCRSMLKGQKL